MLPSGIKEGHEMVPTTVELGQEDPVFLIGTKAYALVRVGDDWQAHEVFWSGDRFTRSGIPVAIDKARIMGVVHQSEHFPASQLGQHLPAQTPTVQHLTDEMDRLNAEADDLRRRSARVIPRQ